MDTLISQLEHQPSLYYRNDGITASGLLVQVLSLSIAIWLLIKKQASCLMA